MLIAPLGEHLLNKFSLRLEASENADVDLFELTWNDTTDSICRKGYHVNISKNLSEELMLKLFMNFYLEGELQVATQYYLVHHHP